MTLQGLSPLCRFSKMAQGDSPYCAKVENLPVTVSE